MGRAEKTARSRQQVNLYAPHEMQKKFHDSEARVRLLLGGVRSGKTLAGANELIKLAIEKAESFSWVVAPNYPLSITAKDYFFKWLPKELIKNEIRMEKRIVLVNDSIIEIKSADNEDSLRGAGLDFCWIDEGAYMSEYAWQIIQTRLSDRKGRCWITTTPKGKSNWVYKLLLEGKGKSKEYETFLVKTKDNPYFPKDEIDRMRRILPTNFFLQEYEAEFIEEGGQFRYDWFEECFDSNCILGNKGKFIGIDLAIAEGGDNFVIVSLSESNGKIRIDDIYIDRGLSPKAMREIIKIKSEKASLVMVENNGFQQYLEKELVEETMLPIRGFTTGKQKADPYLGLPSVAALIENKKFIIPRGDDKSIYITDQLISEALSYPSGHTGDVLMALWFAVEAYKECIGYSQLSDPLIEGKDTMYHQESEKYLIL